MFSVNSRLHSVLHLSYVMRLFRDCVIASLLETNYLRGNKTQLKSDISQVVLYFFFFFFTTSYDPRGATKFYCNYCVTWSFSFLRNLYIYILVRSISTYIFLLSWSKRFVQQTIDSQLIDVLWLSNKIILFDVLQNYKREIEIMNNCSTEG